MKKEITSEPSKGTEKARAVSKASASPVAKKDTDGGTAGKIKTKEEKEVKRQERGMGERMDITPTKSIT